MPILESLASCSPWEPPSIWTALLSMRPWQPCSSHRWRTSTPALLRSSSYGEEGGWGFKEGVELGWGLVRLLSVYSLRCRKQICKFDDKPKFANLLFSLAMQTADLETCLSVFTYIWPL